MDNLHKFVIVGCGSVGDVHARVISGLENAKLMAVVEKDEESGSKFAARYGCNYYSSVQDVIKNEVFSIVSICTPSYSHCKIATDFVNAGKHVIIEKPMDTDLQSVDKLNEISKQKNVKICTIFQHRFDNSVIKVKNAINEGRLGKLYFGACHTKWYRDQKYYESGGWRGTWKYDGGGALINQSIHYIDLLLYLMGDVSEIYGSCGNYAHKNIEVEDLGTALVKFKNGGLGIIEGTTAAYPGLYAKIDIYGEKGSLSIQDDKLVLFKAMGISDEEERDILDKDDTNVGAKDAMSFSIESHTRQYKNMINALETDTEPLVNGLEGRKSLEVVLSIYESWRKNLPVKLN